MPQILQAKVKSVLSGDTVVLCGKPRQDGKPPNERILSLAYVSAPRLKREAEEPFTFSSREYLRKLLVGKDVQFSVRYTVSSMNPPRENGMVFLPGVNVLESALSEGWVKLRDTGRKERAEEEETILVHLQALEDAAKTAEKGIWNPKTSGKVAAKHELGGNIKELLDQWKGKDLDAIVESVPAADRFRLRLLLSAEQHQIVPIVLAGVRSPSPSKKTGIVDDALDQSAQAEEFGDEARWFVESRLLQRNVKVEFLGLNQAGTMFVARARHPAGDIAQLLLTNGLACCADWMSPLLGGDAMLKLREAERQAKSHKLNIWKTHIAKTAQASPSFDAIVFKIINGDTIEVIPKQGGSRRTIQFSSIRQPKTNDPKQAPWQVEVKEYLRKRIIGKTVHIQIDYTKPATEGFEARDAATVTFSGKNIAHELVERGYATVIRHRKDDEDRSTTYDVLLGLEQTAQSESKGIHSGKESRYAGQRIVDASENLSRAKQFLSTFQRAKRLPGVVEHVSSGSRFRVLIPREHCRITFVLGGLRAPRIGRQGDRGEEGGEEALEWTSRRAYQRDVEIEVEATDRAGGFIGVLYVNGNNLGKGLLEDGLAWVQGSSGQEYEDAEDRAKKAHKGIWKDWDESKEAEETNVLSGVTQQPRKEFLDVVVTNMNEDGTLAVQIIGDSVHQLDKLMKEFRAFHDTGSHVAQNVRPGDLVAAKFSGDNEFYRAKVKRVDRAAQKADVMFIDYGNSESVQLSSIRSLGQPSFSALPAQAKEATLSFITVPSRHGDYGIEAHNEFEALTGNKSLVANVDSRAPNGTLSLTLWDPATGRDGPEGSINAEMVRLGLARVLKAKKRGWEKVYGDILEVLGNEEKAAQMKREGMWEYGHVGDSDED